MDLNLEDINVQQLIEADIKVTIVMKDNHKYFGQFMGVTAKKNILPTTKFDQNQEYFTIKHRDQLVHIPKANVVKMDFSL